MKKLVSILLLIILLLVGFIALDKSIIVFNKDKLNTLITKQEPFKDDLINQ